MSVDLKSAGQTTKEGVFSCVIFFELLRKKSLAMCRLFVALKDGTLQYEICVNHLVTFEIGVQLRRLEKLIIRRNSSKSVKYLGCEFEQNALQSK